MEIRLENVTKVIKKKKVLDSITCSFISGNVYGLKGINGSGKSMLMRMLCGLIVPTKGTIWIDNEKVRLGSFPKSIGLLIENPAFISYYSGEKNLELLASINKKISNNAILEILDMVGLKETKYNKFSTYSLGMKQRLGIAAAIMEHPEIIILDEPTNALDSDGIKMFANLINEEKKRGALIVISCHDFSFLEGMSDQIYSIGEGKLL